MSSPATLRLGLPDLISSLSRTPPLRLHFRPSFPSSFIHPKSLPSTPPTRFFTAHSRPRIALPRKPVTLKRGFGSSREAWEAKDAEAAKEMEKVGLLGKVKELTRRYGSAALVVYLGYSAVDFGLTFLLIYAIGADHVREAEDWVLERLQWRRKRPNENKPIVEATRDQVVELEEAVQEKVEQGVAVATGEPRRKAGSDQSALWTAAVLAYAIHKTVLLPVRVGLTAWSTPKIVRTLRSWGWNIGKPAAQAATTATLFPAFVSSRRDQD